MSPIMIAESAVDASTPPNDVNAEQCVLGAMLLSKDAIAEITAVLNPSDFYRPAHITIYTTIMRFYQDGEPADATTVAAALATTGDLARIGGAGYLHTIMASVPTAANGRYYAEIVADRAALRHLVTAGTKIAQLGYQPGSDAKDATDRADQILHQVVSRRPANDTKSFGDLIPSAFKAIEEAGTHTGLIGLSTGLADLDRQLGGLRPGQLIIVAARPGVGKSMLAVEIARAAALRDRKPFLYFSLEMGSNELMLRIIAAETSILLNNLRTGNLDESGWTRMARYIGDHSNAPLYVDDTPDMSLLEIRAKSRRLAQQKGLAGIAVDYLQLVGSPAGSRRSDSREREVAEMSRGLKLLSKELQVPVVAVAQLNRGPEMRADKRPQLSDLRESGSIEQDADVVILLHRDDYYNKESPKAGEIDIDIAKHRDGERATVTAITQFHFARIRNVAKY